MRRLITLISCCWLSTTVVAEVVHCPKVSQLQKVFVGISQSYYWQARVGNTLFASNIRRDRSEQAVDFLPQASYLNGRQPVCAYKVSILRNNRLAYRNLYLSGSAVAPLTQQQIQLQQQRAKTRNAVSQGAMASRWVTPAARQNNAQSLTVPPGRSVTGQPLPGYAPGHP